MTLNKTNIKKVFNKNGLNVIGIDIYCKGSQADVTTVDDFSIYRQYVIAKKEFEEAKESIKTDYVMFGTSRWFEDALSL